MPYQNQPSSVQMIQPSLIGGNARTLGPPKEGAAYPAQAQADWAGFPRVWVTGACEDLLASHLDLSHSRYGAGRSSGRGAGTSSRCWRCTTRP